MNHSDADKLRELPHPDAREGTFDAQLSFETPLVEAPQPVRTIVKRDGREVPFEKRKIADAIFKAAQSIGGQDRNRAESLAAGVAIYLSKMLNGQTPTVDQAHDAVEKVLVEMGHAKTALAYVRYRDKRARIRRLRQGDMRGLLSELQEARRQESAAGPADEPFPLVRTSDERITGWEREKITQALVRETGLDDATASIIAIEAEQQLRGAKVKMLTASLIRELVDAKLIERGLEEHRRKHARLGVPLYDAERIICKPNHYEMLSDHDPETTDLILAERVKREFALSEVFSADVAEGHLSGDIHLHDLGFVDRLHSATLSLDYIKRYGIRHTHERDIRRPPTTSEGLLAQMIEFSALARRHFVGCVSWDAINVLLAAFLQRRDEEGLEQLVRSMAFWCAPWSTTGVRKAPCTELIVWWDIPARIGNMEAIGSGGDSTGRTHNAFIHPAQQLAWALTDIYNDTSFIDGPTAKPTLVVNVTPEFFRSAGHDRFLVHASEAAARSGHVDFSFDRDTGGQEAESDPWHPRAVIVHQVTLNLPRAAFRSDDEETLFVELDRLMETAARAHVQKRNFMERLLALNDSGPLGLLTLPCEGRPYLDLARGEYVVSVLGLNECVQALLGEQLHESEAAMVLGERIVSHLKGLCDNWTIRAELRLAPGQALEAATARRLADLDLHQFPEAAPGVIKTDNETHDIYYTPGAQLAREASVSPMDRVRLEGRFHAGIEAGARSVVRVPDIDASKESIASLVKKAYHQTQNRRLAFSN